MLHSVIDLANGPALFLLDCAQTLQHKDLVTDRTLFPKHPIVHLRPFHGLLSGLNHYIITFSWISKRKKLYASCSVVYFGENLTECLF